MILVSGVLAWVFNFIRQWYTARVVGDVVLKLRMDVFAAVMQRDMSFFDEFPSGKIVARVTSDTEDFATVVTLVLNLLSQLLLVVLIAAVLFYVDVRLALLAFAIAPLIVLIALGFRRIARLTTQHAQRSRATVNALVQETISGISIAKNFRQEAAIYDQFKRVNRQSYVVNLRQGLVFSSIFPVLGLVAALGTTIVVYQGGISVLDHTVSPGAWFLFVQAIGIFWFPLTSIASFWSQFQQGLSASERVFALMDAEPRVRQVGDEPVRALAGRVELRDLTFEYTDGQPVYQHFDLDHPRRADTGHRRAYRRRQDDAGQAGGAASTSSRAGKSSWTGVTSARWTCATIAATWAWCRRCRSSSRARSPRISATRGPRRPKKRWSASRGAWPAAIGWSRCRTGWPPRSARRGTASRWASASSSRSHACSCRTRPS